MCYVVYLRYFYVDCLTMFIFQSEINRFFAVCTLITTKEWIYLFVHNDIIIEKQLS